MLVDFTVGNFLSIKDEVTLSFVQEEQNSSNIIDIRNEKFSLYPCDVLYGPNASGKSNLMKAFRAFIHMVKRSNGFQVDDPITAYNPFLLDKVTRDEPTSFEVEFITGGERYRYSFSFDRTEIVSESLVFYPEGRKAFLFKRKKGKPVKFGTYLKGEKKTIANSLLSNVLFLSRAANMKHDQLLPVYRYLRDSIVFHTNMDSKDASFYNTTIMIDKMDSSFKKRVIQLLNAVDLNISEIILEEDEQQASILNSSALPKAISSKIKQEIKRHFSIRPKLGHSIYSDSGTVVDTHYFDLVKEESGGTIKMYDLAGKIILTLEKGSVLIVDEFDSGLHPFVTQFIVKLFQDLQINKHGAQLLVATHDPLLMDSTELDREQIWFTEKNKFGVTEMYSLGDFPKTSIRKQSSFVKWYLDGRLRAVPATNFSSFLTGN